MSPAREIASAGLHIFIVLSGLSSPLLLLSEIEHQSNTSRTELGQKNIPICALANGDIGGLRVINRGLRDEPTHQGFALRTDNHLQ